MALAAGFAGTLAVALHYRAHLFWLYAASRLGLHDLRAVPNCPMPEAVAPDGWVPCRVGSIEFSLPPELARTMVASKNGGVFTCQHGSRRLIIAAPKALNELSQLLMAASRLRHVSEELRPVSQRLTIPRLRLACYQASPDDFRWSMTGDEVRWHTFCLTMSKVIRLMPDGHAETLFGNNLDRIVHFGPQRAVLDWQSNDRMYGGYIHFIHRDEPLEPAWIRAVCHSLKVVETAKRTQQ